MTVTIMEEGNGWLIIKGEHPKFKECWNGGRYHVRAEGLFDTMSDIAKWANNQLKEEMIFEVE